MANSESTINDAIAVALREINTDWTVYDYVSSENTESLTKKKALRPDSVSALRVTISVARNDLNRSPGSRHVQAT